VFHKHRDRFIAALGSIATPKANKSTQENMTQASMTYIFWLVYDLYRHSRPIMVSKGLRALY